jgi:hypothetical protein
MRVCLVYARRRVCFALFATNKHAHQTPPSRPPQKTTTGFLSRFEGSQCPAKLLEDVTLVDAPGVLSGEKQRVGARLWRRARLFIVFFRMARQHTGALPHSPHRLCNPKHTNLLPP